MKAGLFSVYRWRMRVRYALQGILVFCRTEHNAIIYSISTIAVFIASLMKGVTKIEATALVIVIGIYIGRYLRFNSWDVITNPFQLAGDIVYLAVHPVRNMEDWGMIVCYAILMLLVYQGIERMSRTSL